MSQHHNLKPISGLISLAALYLLCSIAPQNNVVTIGLRIKEAGPTSPLHPGAGTVSRTELMLSCTGSIYQLLSQTNVTPRQCIDALMHWMPELLNAQ